MQFLLVLRLRLLFQFTLVKIRLKQGTFGLHPGVPYGILVHGIRESRVHYTHHGFTAPCLSDRVAVLEVMEDITESEEIKNVSCIYA